MNAPSAMVPFAYSLSPRGEGPSAINPQMRQETRTLEEQSREQRKKRIEAEAAAIVRDLMKLGCPRESTAAIVGFANHYRLGSNGETFGRATIAPGGIYICLNLENRYFPIVLVTEIELMEQMWRFPLRTKVLCRKNPGNKVRTGKRLAP